MNTVDNNDITNLLIQDEPVLTYQTDPTLNDDPLAALMPRLPETSAQEATLLTELHFDRHQHSFFKFSSWPSQTASTPSDADTNPPASAKPPLEHLLAANSHGGDPQKIKAAELALVRYAPLDPQWQAWCKKYADPFIEDKIRTVAATIVEEKGYFGLDIDEQSMLLYDIRFLLASRHHPIADIESWLQQNQIPEQPLGTYFSPTERNPDLAELWLLKRLEDGDIIETLSGLKPSLEFEQTVQQVLTAYTWATPSPSPPL